MRTIILTSLACTLSSACDRAHDRTSGESGAATAVTDAASALDGAAEVASARDAAGRSYPEAAWGPALDARAASLAEDAGHDSDAAPSVPSALDASSRDAAIVDAELDAAVACLAPLSACGDQCVDTRSNGAHCGRCGMACPPGFACNGSACTIEVGCSDGRREAFTSLSRYPTIAGCAATWPLSSLRAPKTGGKCGNSLSSCGVPADACALGWHVCGDHPSGPADLTTRVSHDDCYAQLGRWAAALGDHSCADCGPSSTGAVCCGDICPQQEGSCLWPGMTGWFGVINDVINTCSASENPHALPDIGVLCCRD
jgi:hypothetical protein